MKFLVHNVIDHDGYGFLFNSLVAIVTTFNRKSVQVITKFLWKTNAFMTTST